MSKDALQNHLFLECTNNRLVEQVKLCGLQNKQKTKKTAILYKQLLLKCNVHIQADKVFRSHKNCTHWWEE